MFFFEEIFQSTSFCIVIETVLIPYLGEWLNIFHQPLKTSQKLPDMVGHVGKDSPYLPKN